VFAPPVVLFPNDNLPIAIFAHPVVLSSRALLPIAIFSKAEELVELYRVL